MSKENKDVEKLKKQAKKTEKKVQKWVEEIQEDVVLWAMWFFSEQKIIDAIAYIPYFIGPVIAYFLWKADKTRTLHHIKYAFILAVWAIVLTLVLNSFFSGIINLAYIIASAFFGFKALRGDDVQIQIFDSIEDKLIEQVKK